jgi:hypothetical protein
MPKPRWLTRDIDCCLNLNGCVWPLNKKREIFIKQLQGSVCGPNTLTLESGPHTNPGRTLLPLGGRSISAPTSQRNVPNLGLFQKPRSTNCLRSKQASFSRPRGVLYPGTSGSWPACQSTSPPPGGRYPGPKFYLLPYKGLKNFPSAPDPTTHPSPHTYHTVIHIN